MVQVTYILEHPTGIDLRKMGQLWFPDYVEYDLDARGAEDQSFSF